MVDTPSAMESNKPSDEQQYPAVKQAYDFVFPSYQWAIVRVEAAVTRIHSLMMFAATMTLGAPVIGRALNDHVRFASPWFVGALVLFVGLMILGLVAREYGALMLTSPGALYDEALDLGEWEFKRYVVYFAGKHFEQNRRLIEKKSQYGMIMAVLLTLETLAIVIWLATELPR